MLQIYTMQQYEQQQERYVGVLYGIHGAVLSMKGIQSNALLSS
jgi:hypothetical protein